MSEYPSARRIEIRRAEEIDNQAVLALSPRCVQKGMVTMYPDRSPVFNRLHRLVDPDSYHMIAVDGSRVVGLLGVLHTNIWFGDRAFRTAYLMDFRVDPEYRLGLTAYRMVRPAIENERESCSRMALATLLKNNEAPMAFTRGRGGFPASLYLGDNRIFSFAPIRRLKTGSRFSIRQATEDDLPALVGLYNRFYRKYRLAPRMDEETLLHLTRNIEGLGIDRFFLAMDGDAVKAVVAAWDAESLKRYMVTRSNLRVKLISGLVRFLSHFGKMPEPIRVNEPLKQLTLILFAHDDCPDALRSLFRYVNNLHVGGEYSLIQVQMNQEDPLNETLRGLAGVSVYTEIHLFTDTLQFAREIRNAPGLVHLDLPTLI